MDSRSLVQARLVLQVDGTPGPRPGAMAGLGIVVRSMGGEILAWRCERAPARTSVEAEYQALIAGLALVLHLYPSATARCLSDSRVVIDQMAGRAAVRAPGLVSLHSQATSLAQRLAHIDFEAIPRELNRLADALAWEALIGQRALRR